MCNLFKNNVPLIIAILKLCTETYGENQTSAISLHDFTLICGITDGKSEVKTIPPQCTAIAEYSNDLDRLKKVFDMKGSLRFIIIIDTVNYNSPEELANLDDIIKNYKFDFLVLDIYKLARHIGPDEPIDFIRQYVKTIRDKTNGAGIGFLIPNDPSLVDGLIKYKHVNEIADFFILQSTGYTSCDYAPTQGEMLEIATVDDIKNAINYLKDKKLDISKLIFTMELKIESKLLLSSEAMTYSYLCSNKLSVDRRYCYQTEQCLFNKAKLRAEFNLTGIFIMGIEYDDVDGTCGCITECDSDPKFRGLKNIAVASQGTVNSSDLYKCCKGAFPVIKQ